MKDGEQFTASGPKLGAEELNALGRLDPVTRHFRCAGATKKRLIVRLTLLVVCTGLGGWLALRRVPLPPELFADPPPQIELVDRQGQLLRSVRVGERPFTHAVAYAEIPSALVEATLAAEDRRFWHHPGVDWRASLRAAGQLIRNRRIVSGGSTVTQQLIKLAHPRPRTFPVKLIEALQALRLEQVWDKRRILAEYLNRIDYGNLNAGCGAAAGFYFAKPLRDLSAAECALLAGLPQGPSRLNPLKHFQRAHKRQQWILERMLAAGWLTPADHARAVREPLRLSAGQRAFAAPHFVDLLLEQAQALRPLGVAKGGAGDSACRVRTTLDLDLTRFASEALRRRLARLRDHQVRNGAVVVIENQSGEVLALVGSEDYFAPAAGQVNGAWAPRSAGSTFKPFTYLLAFERGATSRERCGRSADGVRHPHRPVRAGQL